MPPIPITSRLCTAIRNVIPILGSKIAEMRSRRGRRCGQRLPTLAGGNRQMVPSRAWSWPHLIGGREGAQMEQPSGMASAGCDGGRDRGREREVRENGQKWRLLSASHGHRLHHRWGCGEQVQLNSAVSRLVLCLSAKSIPGQPQGVCWTYLECHTPLYELLDTTSIL